MLGVSRVGGELMCFMCNRTGDNCLYHYNILLSLPVYAHASTNSHHPTNAQNRANVWLSLTLVDTGLGVLQLTLLVGTLKGAAC